MLCDGEMEGGGRGEEEAGEHRAGGLDEGEVRVRDEEYFDVRGPLK